ncbi:hypothetical protein HYPSUDRAFT_206541 [Hypholoma sublateritium FD-334 SS-4]|uniref:Uncharacterized protein n=1 Tax=Hypholoma sublateritium (strain FD-334 SS-4) TaxID=945553 RepID=A0A0D2P9D4_HYPSF|nr:hypothetical protein HYPSUDRAFT_206541 [Hypholoma sublateritium FD-334 SS-4]
MRISSSTGRSAGQATEEILNAGEYKSDTPRTEHRARRPPGTIPSRKITPHVHPRGSRTSSVYREEPPRSPCMSMHEPFHERRRRQHQPAHDEFEFERPRTAIAAMRPRRSDTAQPHASVVLYPLRGSRREARGASVGPPRGTRQSRRKKGVHQRRPAAPVRGLHEVKRCPASYMSHMTMSRAGQQKVQRASRAARAARQPYDECMTAHTRPRGARSQRMGRKICYQVPGGSRRDGQDRAETATAWTGGNARTERIDVSSEFEWFGQHTHVRSALRRRRSSTGGGGGLQSKRNKKEGRTSKTPSGAPNIHCNFKCPRRLRVAHDDEQFRDSRR